MRVGGWIHGRATHRGPEAEPTLAAGLAQFDVPMIGIADLANGRHTFHKYQSHLA
jgi:hypothetical protein